MSYHLEAVLASLHPKHPMNKIQILLDVLLMMYWFCFILTASVEVLLRSLS